MQVTAIAYILGQISDVALIEHVSHPVVRLEWLLIVQSLYAGLYVAEVVGQIYI